MIQVVQVLATSLSGDTFNYCNNFIVDESSTATISLLNDTLKITGGQGMVQS